MIKSLRSLFGSEYHNNIKEFKYGEYVGAIIFTTSLPIDQTFVWNLRIPGLYKIETLESNSGSMVYEFKFSSPQTAQWVYEALTIYDGYDQERSLRGEIQRKLDEMKKDKEKE